MMGCFRTPSVKMADNKNKELKTSSAENKAVLKSCIVTVLCQFAGLRLGLI